MVLMRVLNVLSQAVQIIIGCLVLCLSASVLQLHEIHFTGDVAVLLIVVLQVSEPLLTPTKDLQLDVPTPNPNLNH